MATTTLDVEGEDIAAALTAWAGANPSAAAALVTALGGALSSALIDLDDQETLSAASGDILNDYFGKLVRLTNAAPVWTVQPQATIAYSDLFNCEILGHSAFQIVGATGVSINGQTASTWNCGARPGAVTLSRVSSNTWDLVGDCEQA